MSAAAPTPFEFAKQIAARRRMRRAVIFYVNAALAGGAVAQNFLSFVFGELSALPENLQFGLAQKPFRPYLRRRLKAAERAEILRAHYQMLAQSFLPGALQELIGQPGKKLATLTGKSGGTYSFYWGLSTTKEGETDFYFWDDQLNAPLATLTGVFAGNKFYIGGLRGIKPPLGRNEIVAATRDLHALRPKHAVLAGACAAARAMGVDILIAPTQANHITRNFGFASREILADYDNFWQEFTDERQPGGDYIIPNILPRREAADVKSKKRSEWLKRMAHLDALAEQVTVSLKSVASNSSFD